MAAASAPHEVEDLVTCGVCYFEYDEVLHRPKFLNCFHTVCLQCLTTMCKEKRVSCPLCRQETVCPSSGPSALASNPYVLQVAKMHLADFVQPAQQCEWCFTCGSASVSADCSTAGHWLVTGHVSEAQRMQKRLDSTKMKYALALEKRQQNRMYLQRMQRVVNRLADNIQDETEDNDMQMTRLASLLEDEVRHCGRESLESARQQIDRQAQEAQQLLQQIGQSMDQHQAENKLRLQIEIRHPHGHKVATQSFLDNEFRRDCSREGGDFADEKDVLSYLIFSIFRRCQVDSKSEAETKCPQDPVPTQLEAAVESCTAVETVSIPAAPVKSVLVITFQDGGQSIGHLRIRPSVDFIDGFVSRFERCATYENRISKAKAGSFLTLEMFSDQPIKGPSYWSSQEILTASEVGISEELVEENGHVLYWNWVFLLKNFDRREVKPSFHFGHLIEGSDVVKYLTSINRNRRSEIKFTVKSV